MPLHDAPAAPKLYAGYDPHTDTEYLLTVYDNGERELITRPGNGDTAASWSAPVTLTGVRS